MPRYIHHHRNLLWCAGALLVLTHASVAADDITINESAIFPSEDSICGVSCLYVVCRLHDLPVTFSQLYARIPVDRYQGTSMLELKKAGEELGFVARGEKVSSRDLDAIPLPAIAHLTKNHFVVLLSVEPESVNVVDPPSRLERMTRKAFENEWSGYLLILQPPGQSSAVPGKQLAMSTPDAPEGRPERENEHSLPTRRPWLPAIGLLSLVIAGGALLAWRWAQRTPSSKSS